MKKLNLGLGIILVITGIAMLCVSISILNIELTKAVSVFRLIGIAGIIIGIIGIVIGICMLLPGKRDKEK